MIICKYYNYETAKLFVYTLPSKKSNFNPSKPRRRRHEDRARRPRFNGQRKADLFKEHEEIGIIRSFYDMTMDQAIGLAHHEGWV